MLRINILSATDIVPKFKVDSIAGFFNKPNINFNKIEPNSLLNTLKIDFIDIVIMNIDSKIDLLSLKNISKNSNISFIGINNKESLIESTKEYFFYETINNDTNIIQSLSIILKCLIKNLEIQTKHNSTLLELEDSEKRFKGAFNHSASGMTLIGLNMEFLMVNKAFCDMLCYKENELIGKKFQDITFSGDQNIGSAKINELITGKTNKCKIEKRYITKNNDVIWVNINASTVRNETKEPIYFVTQIENITDKKKNEVEIQNRAYYDQLTKLPNRTLFYDRCNQVLANASRNGTSFSIIFIDIDDFKTVNDSLGHSAGDHLLIEFSNRLKECARETDTISRWAGDEYTIVLPNVNSSSNAMHLAKRIGGRDHF